MSTTSTLAINIEKLNEDIMKFPQVHPVTPDMKMELKGVSRLVMLDRYTFKDILKDTLGSGDLVLFTYKDDPKFPKRGFGIVSSYNQTTGEVVIDLDESFEGGGSFTKHVTEIDKPMEIYYEQIAKRNATGLAKPEPDTNREEIKNSFYNVLATQRFVPAGRVLYGAGANIDVTYFNCYVMPHIHDSRGGIGEHRKQTMEIMSRGGGVGTNGSTLRPRNAVCHGVNGRSSGAVTWLHDLSELTHLVQQGGSRRGAQMIMMNDWHPDIIEFIISKIQNPRVLRFLIENSKSELIRREAEAKLKFIPLKEVEKKGYEVLVAQYAINDSTSLDDTPKEVKEAMQLLKDGGRYEVVNPEFLTGANISICLTNDFMDAVDNGESYPLRFPDLENYSQEEREYYDAHWQQSGDVREWEKEHGMAVKTYHTVDAKEIWNLINICATYSAEPGIFFLDNANEMTNASAYGQKVVATNPCGEQPLAPYSVCNLAAVNLAEHATADGKLDKEKLIETVKIGIRMQDNVIDSTPYFLPENTKQALGERRIGMGVMGLHDLLIKCGLMYGSEQGNDLVNEVFEIMATTAYRTSIELAKEKGSFPFLNDVVKEGDDVLARSNREAFINTGYMKKMPEDIRQGVLKHGIRNSHLLTVAPTGSTGTMVGCSTGLEPYFSFMYYRSGRLGKFIPVVSDIAVEWLERVGYEVTDENVYEMLEKLPNHFVGAMDLTPEQHADVQCIIQYWVDSSISKTVNAPKGYSVKQVQAVYERLHKGGAKGGTVYVDGSRDAQVLSLTNEDNDMDEVEVSDGGETPVKQSGIPTLDSTSVADDNTDIIDVSDLGVEIGDTCPICQVGTVTEAGGCNTCTNCGAQLKCGL